MRAILHPEANPVDLLALGIIAGGLSLALAGVITMTERYPEDEFAIREGMVDGMYAIMIVNHALKNYGFRDEFPWHLWIDIEIGHTVRTDCRMEWKPKS